MCHRPDGVGLDLVEGEFPVDDLQPGRVPPYPDLARPHVLPAGLPLGFDPAGFDRTLGVTPHHFGESHDPLVDRHVTGLELVRGREQRDDRDPVAEQGHEKRHVLFGGFPAEPVEGFDDEDAAPLDPPLLASV
jgi:hypothetical protein